MKYYPLKSCGDAKYHIDFVFLAAFILFLVKQINTFNCKNKKVF